MRHTKETRLDLDAADKTIVRSGDREITTFVANEFWQAASATNGAKTMPLDPDNEAVDRSF